MNRRRILTVCTCLVATLVFMQPVSAQVLGSISGFVTDESGAALPGVDVEGVNVETGARRAGLTSAAGFYTLAALSAGNYSVTASLDGFQSVRRENVVVKLGQDVTIGLSLAVGSVAEAILVTAESPLIEVSRSSTASYISEEEIAALPIAGRDFTDFALLTPTVQRDTSRGFLTMSGQRGIYTGLNIDGTSAKSAFFGYGRGGEATENDGLVVAQDSVKEFQVVTNGFAPEYGASGGGYINVVTKSGTNDLNGSAFFFLTDDSMLADIPASPLDVFEGRPEATTPDTFERTNLGASIGGAFVQDKTHYFVSIDVTARDEPFTRTIRTPGVYDAILQRGQTEAGFTQLVDGYSRNADGTATGLFNRSVDNQIIFLKLDQQFNDSNSGSFRINNTEYERVSSFFAEESLKIEDTNSFVGALVSVIGGDKVNEARVQFATDELDRLSQFVGTPVEAQVRFRFGSFDSVGKFDFLPIFVEEDTLQIQDNFSYLFGDHDVKFGVDYQEDNLAQLFAGSADGRYDFGSIDDFLANNAIGARIYFGDRSFPNYDETQTLTSFYAQDAWRPNARLTVNYGFRWSETDNPDGLEHVLPIARQIPDDDHIAPRLGFTYALDDEGTKVIRGGFGLFYGRTPTLLFASQVQENGISPNLGRVFVGPGDIGFVPLGQPIDSENPPDGIIPTVGYVDPSYEDVETERINLGYEQQLGTGWSAGVDLVLAEADGLQTNIDINRTLSFDEFGRPMFSSTRPNPEFGEQLVRFSAGRSKYEALTLKVNKRYSGKFQLQAHYTYSKDESNDDNERSATGVSVSNPQNLDYDFGLSSRDVENRLVVSGLVDLPWGFRLSGSAENRSGRPFTGADPGVDFAYCGFGRLGFDCPTARAVVNGRVVGRNTFRNESISTVDMRLTKSFAIGPTDLDLFIEAFNLFDDSSFAVNNSFRGNNERDPASDTFGLAEFQVGEQRRYQVGARINF